jgi:hypothetical protein
VIEALTGKGYSVQLKLLGEEDRDAVIIKDNGGKELARHGDMQHNKNFYDQEANAAQLVDSAVGLLAAQPKTVPKTVPAANLKAATEVSTTA